MRFSKSAKFSSPITLFLLNFRQIVSTSRKYKNTRKLGLLKAPPARTYFYHMSKFQVQFDLDHKLRDTIMSLSQNINIYGLNFKNHNFSYNNAAFVANTGLNSSLSSDLSRQEHDVFRPVNQCLKYLNLITMSKHTALYIQIYS